MIPAERLYRALLTLYPADFRAEFGGPMAQLFRDQLRDASRAGRAGMIGLWLRTLADLATSAAREHMERNSLMRTLVLAVTAVIFGLGIGWLDIHNDEIWAALILLLTATFLLGFSEPRQAWRWALLVAGGMMLVHAGAAIVAFVGPCHSGEVCPPASVQPADALLALPALFGVYCGVGIRALSGVTRGDEIWWIGSALLGIGFGLLSLRSNGAVVRPLVIGLLGVLAGFTRPSHVWRWALALGLGAGIFSSIGQLTNKLGALALTLLLVIFLPVFIGAFAGYALRGVIDKYLPKNSAPKAEAPAA